MRKMNFKNSMIALMVLTVFFGTLTSVMVLGMDAANTVRQNAIQKQSQTVQVKQIVDVKPVRSIPLMSSVIQSLDNNSTDHAPKFKEVIVCQVIDGVKHFSNYFEEVV